MSIKIRQFINIKRQRSNVKKNLGHTCMIMNELLSEKCPNTELFLVRI